MPLVPTDLSLSPLSIEQTAGEIKLASAVGVITPRPLRADIARFVQTLSTTDPRQCWIQVTRAGQPRRRRGGFSWGLPRRVATPYRFAYELLVGPVPPGYHLRHHPECVAKSCANPAHLTCLSAQEHAQLTAHLRRQRREGGAL